MSQPTEPPTPGPPRALAPLPGASNGHRQEMNESGRPGRRKRPGRPDTNDPAEEGPSAYTDIVPSSPDRPSKNPGWPGPGFCGDANCPGYCNGRPARHKGEALAWRAGRVNALLLCPRALTGPACHCCSWTRPLAPGIGG